MHRNWQMILDIIEANRSFAAHGDANAQQYPEITGWANSTASWTILHAGSWKALRRPRPESE